eukprot:2748061-Prorocentrum_lima.AAC.1
MDTAGTGGAVPVAVPVLLQPRRAGGAPGSELCGALTARTAKRPSRRRLSLNRPRLVQLLNRPHRRQKKVPS